ncbi:hypothetical protein SB861_24365 [Paraburkholderia sp. SIMBA_049]
MKRRSATFDVMPYWMWVVRLIVLDVMCGAALSFEPSKFRAARRGLHGLRKLH